MKEPYYIVLQVDVERPRGRRTITSPVRTFTTLQGLEEFRARALPRTTMPYIQWMLDHMETLEMYEYPTRGVEGYARFEHYFIKRADDALWDTDECMRRGGDDYQKMLLTFKQRFQFCMRKKMADHVYMLDSIKGDVPTWFTPYIDELLVYTDIPSRKSLYNSLQRYGKRVNTCGGFIITKLSTSGLDVSTIEGNYERNLGTGAPGNVSVSATAKDDSYAWEDD